MQEIIEYLQQKYAPAGIVVYGSYADGSNNAHSDFDALVLTDRSAAKYDNSTVGGVLLDVFLYPVDTFLQPFACEDFLQLHDGKILLDTTDSLAQAKAKVTAFVEGAAKKSAEEIAHDLSWCEKMRLRAGRGDAEGDYRWHWVLIDSLQIYYELCGKYYFGPKKALRQMEREDPDAFALYSAALRNFTAETLDAWIAHLQSMQKS